MSDETLRYPKEIAKEIGLGVNEVNALKRLGCPFYGRKTCVKWVRTWLAQQAGHLRAGSESGPVLAGHHQH